MHADPGAGCCSPKRGDCSLGDGMATAPPARARMARQSFGSTPEALRARFSRRRSSCIDDADGRDDSTNDVTAREMFTSANSSASSSLN